MCRVNLGSSRCTGQVKGSTRTSTERDLLFLCQQPCDIFYLTLVDKTYPGDDTGGAIRPATTLALVTVDTRQLDPGVSRFFVSTDLCCFYPPSEPKSSVLPTPPPFPDSFSHTLLTHIQIKKRAPASLFY